MKGVAAYEFLDVDCSKRNSELFLYVYFHFPARLFLLFFSRFEFDLSRCSFMLNMMTPSFIRLTAPFLVIDVLLIFSFSSLLQFVNNLFVR